MSRKSIALENLLLDLENPRITKAGSQREALQRIIEDQDVRLAYLAESIVAQGGLNPMDRWLVLPASDKGKFVVYEGNRRLSALKILKNPTVLGGLEVRSPVKKRLEAAAKEFDPKTIGPIDCFLLSSREEGALWLHQRHTGANKGSGIVDWNGMATARFRGTDAALQAFDMVLKFGELSSDDKEAIEDRFPITTLDRLLSTPAVRELIGFDKKQSKLLTDLPPPAAVKVMRRIVLDLSYKEVNVTKLKLKNQQVDYVRALGPDLPDLTKRSGSFSSVEEWDESTFAEGGENGGRSGGGSAGTGASKGRSRRKKPAQRRTLITKDCVLNVDNPKIMEIEDELRGLLIANHRHAIAVLFRVFLETSVDVYLRRVGVTLTFTDGGGHERDKTLKAKVAEAITAMVAAGAVKKSLNGVANGINDPKNALFIDTLHAYVHNEFYSPKESDLTTAFDNARPFFETIWK